ncbi:hypothetical protein OA187_04990, partial [Candidatus Pelagibacter sp.]|nr:hypothetical protein [Candidatus Pelagibacter sp.]
KINFHSENYLNKDNFIKLILLIFVFILIYGSEFSDDLNHYHGGYIINTDNLNYIIGLNFLHHHYGYSSIWLILHSYLNFNGSLLQDIHILNGIIYFSVVGLIINEILKNTKNKQVDNFYLILIFLLFFILIKYTRIKEFGIDRPGFLIIVFFFYYYFSFYFSGKENLTNYKNLLFISFFLFCIKIIFLPFFIISLVLMLKYLILNKSSDKISTNYIFLLFFIFSSYLIKNALISGCIIYPVDKTCLSFLSWNSNEIIQSLTLNTEYFNKSYNSYLGNLSPDLYIVDFNWLNNWYQRNSNELLEYILVIAASVIFSLISINTYKSNKLNYNYIFYILLIIFIFSFLIALKTPVIRMFHHLFYIFGIFIILLATSGKKVFIKKKPLYFFLIIIIFFSLSKNIKRIYDNNFVNNPEELIKKIGWYETPKQKQLGSFEYFGGWNSKYPIGNEDLSNYKYRKFLFFNVIYK